MIIFRSGLTTDPVAEKFVAGWFVLLGILPRKVMSLVTFLQYAQEPLIILKPMAHTAARQEFIVLLIYSIRDFSLLMMRWGYPDPFFPSLFSTLACGQ